MGSCRVKLPQPTDKFTHQTQSHLVSDTTHLNIEIFQQTVSVISIQIVFVPRYVYQHHFCYIRLTNFRPPSYVKIKI